MGVANPTVVKCDLKGTSNDQKPLITSYPFSGAVGVKLNSQATIAEAVLVLPSDATTCRTKVLFFLSL
jgi:hypothetical protein